MYFGPVTAVGGIITDDTNRVLLIERARDPGAGKLGMPGGFVDPYESAEACLHREVWEEVGLVIHEVGFLLTAPNRYTYHNIDNPVLDIFYHAKVKGSPEIKPEATEVANWQWADITPDLLDRMAFASNRVALEFFLTTLRV